MAAIRTLFSAALVAVLFSLIQPVSGDTYQVIIQGKVVMEDGSPPPKSVGIERHCSDMAGSAPGPITNKKGEYLWRMDMDPFLTRSCVIRATFQGYESSSIEISGLNATSHDTTATLPPLKLTPRGGSATTITVPDSQVPARAHAAWKAAMKALEVRNYSGAANQLQAAVAAVPNFAQGWNTLGGTYEQLDALAEARDAYQHAIDADPKLIPAYVALTRLSVKTKEWDAAAKNGDTVTKADTRQVYPEIYLYLAVARYYLKDLAAAEASAQESIRLDPNHKRVRAEYILGRILEAKGDLTGAREHMSRYIELDPAAADLELIRTHLQNLGKPEATAVDPDLALP